MVRGAGLTAGASIGAVAIEVAGVSKTFRHPARAADDAQGVLPAPVPAHGRTSSNQALDDVSFTVATGEFFGVIGPNGSGKSTLLKILAGIYRPDAGAVAGRRPALPLHRARRRLQPRAQRARQHPRSTATLLGLTAARARRALRRRSSRFAELERFVDQKLKNYSSGMQVRLAFSIAIQVPFDILLLDEVLAVGDQRFQEKCFATFDAIRDAGKTVVFVSHDLGTVERFCTRTLYIDHGRVQAVGPTDDVISLYLDRVAAMDAQPAD